MEDLICLFTLLALARLKLLWDVFTSKQSQLKLQKKLQTSDDNNKIEFQIAQKKLRREKIIQQIFTYTYGEMDSKLKEALINAEKYRNEIATNRSYRKTFDANNLPDLYSMWTFFRKDATIVNSFFDLGRDIIQHPVEFANIFLTSHKPKIMGTDEAFALAAQILDIADDIAYPLEFPRIVHMKPMIQNWPWPANKWSDHVGFYLNKQGRLKIGNYQQNDIVHYVEKNKIDRELTHILEEIAWKQ